MFKVQAKPCATCIYLPTSPLDIAQLEAEVADAHMPGFFTSYRVCHHSADACCFGFWQRHADAFTLGQVATRMGLVAYVNEDRLGMQRSSSRKDAVMTSLPCTYVTLLLDESGSMQSIADDTIGGFNHYLQSLQDPDAGEVVFTFVKFDSNAITKVHVGIPVREATCLTTETYRPGASTPLIDATYKTILATAEVVAHRADTPQVLVVIQTDGHENASTEYTNDDLHALVKEKTALGWQFLFLGAGIDAFAQAGQWGIGAQQTLSYARSHSAETFRSLRVNTTQYRSSGRADSLAFTPGQRTAAGERPWNTPAATPTPPAAGDPETRRQIVDDVSFLPS